MPFSPKERQYRNFSVSNFGANESQENEGRSYRVRGYFTTFNEPYELWPGYFEEIDQHAFDECDMSDVIMQVNHDGHVFARTRNGSLLLAFDEHGGIGEADLSGSKRGREELYESIVNGLVDRMSFGFNIADDGFEYTVDGDGVYHTRITKISKLYDISAIEGFPANDGTEISARSYFDGAIKRIEAERLQGALEAKKASELRRKRMELRAKAMQLRH